jgi:transposase
LTASTLVDSAGDPRNFKNARQFAAWIGLVPNQHSSGGKTQFAGHQKTRRRVPAHLVDPR